MAMLVTAPLHTPDPYTASYLQQQTAPLLSPATLASLAPTELKGALEQFFQEHLARAETDDPLISLHTVAEELPLQNLTAAIREAYPSHRDAIHVASDMIETAKCYLEKSNNQREPIWQAKLAHIGDMCIATIEGLIAAFGVGDFFEPTESAFHASTKFQKIMMLLSFTLLTTQLLPIIGPATCGLFVGGALVAIAALSLIYPHICPSPYRLPHAVNWTKMIQQCELPPVDGRKVAIEAIADTLINNKRVKLHPMLIGRSRVGKTLAVKAFAHAVERGDFPDLAGKKVFYINTADLVNASDPFAGQNKALENISKAMGRHRENIILVFDEIHLACQRRDRTALGDQLKILLDDGSENFPYVIGITTEEDYIRDIYQHDSAFAARFKKIPLTSTTPSESLEILSSFLLRESPQTVVDPAALTRLLELSQESFQENAIEPATSLRILSQCIQHKTDTQKSPLEQRIISLRSQLDSLYSEGAMRQGHALFSHREDRQDQFTELQEAIATLTGELATERKKFAQLFQIEAKLHEVKERTMRTAIKVAALGASLEPSSEQHSIINEFLLLGHFLAPALETQMRTQAQEIGARIAIDEDLIRMVIAEEQENERKAQEVLNSGRAQLNARAAT